ncbi:MAG: hemerythrin family protein [Acidobacteriota bacterium]|nr:hemerythrin family protein [Acidobacteriota bacterium]
MSVVHWTPDFETGIGFADAQHRDLFDVVNRLGEAAEGPEPAAQTARTLRDLMDQTVAHFREEEACMQAHGFPGFAAHASEHTRLMRELQRFQDAVEAGRGLPPGSTAFLAEWLKHHIQESDKAYVPFLKAHGVV